MVKVRPTWVLVEANSHLGGRSILDCRLFGVALTETEASHMLVMLAKFSGLPRLETRTKEFNMCASTGVANSHAQ